MAKATQQSRVTGVTGKIVTRDGEIVGTPSTLDGKNVRQIVADAYTFIRSAEANKAISAVTIEQLMNDQIKRNGDTTLTNKSQYNPYSYDPDKSLPVSEAPTDYSSFIGMADTNKPTKIDRITALKSVIDGMVDGIKKLEVLDVANAGAYAGGAMEATKEEQ
jgi:hypothetical protein